MKHARSDYNRIQDPAGLIAADEPVFLIRAKDEVSGRAVLVHSLHLNPETHGQLELRLTEDRLAKGTVVS